MQYDFRDVLYTFLRLVENGMPGKLLNVYAHEAGGGKYLAVLQFKKTSVADEGRQRQAAVMAFAAFSELKHVILVDEDVDIFDTNDVLWAMTTRYQGDVSTVFIPGVRCHPLDPSQRPEFSSSSRESGVSCKNEMRFRTSSSRAVNRDLFAIPVASPAGSRDAMAGLT